MRRVAHFLRRVTWLETLAFYFFSKSTYLLFVSSGRATRTFIKYAEYDVILILYHYTLFRLQNNNLVKYAST